MTPASPVEDLSMTQLAERVRAEQQAAEAAQRAVFELAVTWGHAHPELDRHGAPVPVERVDDQVLAAHFAGLDPEEEIDSSAWAGLPPIDEAAAAGFGCAANTSTRAARSMLRDALTIHHRLPRLQAHLSAGAVPVWQARRIAQAVAGAPADVVATIDAALAERAGRIGPVLLGRLIAEAMIRLYPNEVEMASLDALDRRSVHFERDSVGHTELAWMNIHTDYADLDDLDTTLTALAHRLAETDHETAGESLEVRRALAIGILTDPERAHHLLHTDHDTGDGPSTEADADASHSNQRRGNRPRQTMLVVRVSDLALWGLDPAASCDGGPVTLSDRVASWCGRETTDLLVLPVLDPDAHAHSEAYQPPASMKRHIDQRDQQCLFPWCTRSARTCDHDHVVPHDDGGATCICNLIPLCRHHHRLKTLHGYRVSAIEPGVAWWRTPHGFEFVVDHTGTRAITAPTRDPDDHPWNGCLQRTASEPPDGRPPPRVNVDAA